MRAYVLLALETGHEIETTTAIRGMAGVHSVDLMSGPWDAMVHVESEDIGSVVQGILAMENVEDTQTNFVVEID